jgi:protocatechuate 3,4-dioxygenase beta subunit
MLEKKMSRRDLLKGIGAMGMMAAAGPLMSLASCVPRSSTGNNSNPSNTSANGINATPDCVLTPEVTEGPYYIAASQMRQDITDGKTGAPMEMVIQVVNAKTCAPISSAMVDVWHADAEGLYSAYPGQGDSRSVDTSSERFLRGIQTTDSTGTATFKSIYPGWYRGRTTHVHFKIHFNNNTQVTSQFVFPEAVNSTVYNTGVYAARGDKDTPNASDMVFKQAGSPQSMEIKVEKQGEGYVAKLVVGIVLS